MKGFSKLTEGLLGQPMLEILTSVCAMERQGKRCIGLKSAMPISTLIRM